MLLRELRHNSRRLNRGYANMVKDIRLVANALYVASSFQDLYAVDRQVFALRFITTEGLQIIVELPGQGAKYLRDKMLEAFASHPQMEKWGNGVRPN